MRNLLGMVKNAIGVQTDDYDDYDEDEYDDRDDGRIDYKKSVANEYEERARKTHNTPAAQTQSKVVTMPHEASEMKVVVLSPSQYDDARNVCNNLKAWSPVILKLDKLDRDEAQRVVDFISGACYTMDGHVQEIKEDVFLIAPSMINIEKEKDDITTIKSSSFFSKFAAR